MVSIVFRFFILVLAGIFAPFISSARAETAADMAQTAVASTEFSCEPANTVLARVVALEQVYVYNRFGAFNPGGMLYALRRDVVTAEDEEGSEDGVAIPLVPDASVDRALAGNVRLRDGKRPRPIVLRVNEGECLKIVFTNLLSPERDGEEHVIDPATGLPLSIDSDEPATRAASIHVNGLELSGSILSDGTNVGFNPSSLAVPGETREYELRGRKEGAYLLYSMGAAAGGEGDGGQLGLGLFGSVNVEPRGSSWYRSQVTAADMHASLDVTNPRGSLGISAKGTPIINFESEDAQGNPILDLTRKLTASEALVWRASREIVHSDLNAIVDVRKVPENCDYVKGPGSSCGQPFREFTVIFHDEITAVQAFPQLDNEDDPVSALKDGMGINYGAAGLGAMVLANRLGIGPAKDCVECKLEEFFLTSWAMGDPALVLERDEDNKAIGALYPDDPSNVHHSYLGDPVRFRNLHAGPKETHVFHLHAHQWAQDWQDDNSVYLDSQTISPGASFTYEVHYGGSGNRNLTPGDAIFHCHLYPHFAQGMWELWRTHDVFEAGTVDRNLPDYEISGGTPNPAVVPLPGSALPPMPTAKFAGYPFYIAGVPGHRPPQAPYDIDPNAYGAADADDTLMRHVITGGERETGSDVFALAADGDTSDMEKKYFEPPADVFSPESQSVIVAKRVKDATGPDVLQLAAKLTRAEIETLPLDGTPSEKAAMDFHAGKAPGAVSIASSPFGIPQFGYPTCRTDGTCTTDDPSILFRVNGYEPQPGAPFADPCAKEWYTGATKHSLGPLRTYRAAYIQFDMPVNKHGWHDPQARIITLEEDAKAVMDHERAAEPFFFRAKSGECIQFTATNLIPSNLNLDDFQVFTPTDTIGQHIHLVKFDVTASDGSGNGWNYEDGTFSPDEIRERIIAGNTEAGTERFRLLTHRIFLEGPLAGDPRGLCPETLPLDPLQAERALEEHPWCGAQSTIQRWWADPLLNGSGEDRTIRTVFTHDHFGPSSAQQHGFYAALVIEPDGSSWESLAGRPFGSSTPEPGGAPLRADGGPTSFAANILEKSKDGEPEKARREFNVAVADFALLYTAPPENRPISPPGLLDHDLPEIMFWTGKPKPEGISVSDPGGQLINYRNEPVPLRVGTENANGMFSLREFDPSSAATKACVAAIASGQQTSTGPTIAAGLLKHCEGQPEAAQCRAQAERALCDPSDLSNVFSSFAHAGQDAAEKALISPDPNVYDTRRIFHEVYLARDCTDTDDLNCNEPAGLRRDGDPSTSILAAREGDDIQVRLIQGAQEENHIFFMNGAKWLAEPGSANSGYRAAQHIGISEHFEFNIALNDPSAWRTKDHLYGTTATDNIWDGQWGVLRLSRPDPEDVEALDAHLAVLPKGDSGLVSSGGPGVQSDQENCTEDTAGRRFKVEAWRIGDLTDESAGSLLSLDYHEKRKLQDPNARIYVLASEEVRPDEGSDWSPAYAGSDDRSAMDARLIALGKKQPEPLILRARAGECIVVELTNMLGSAPEFELEPNGAGGWTLNTDPSTWSWNMMPPIANGLNFNQVRASNAVGLHAQLVATNVALNDGSAAGLNNSTLAYPCPDDPLATCVDPRNPPGEGAIAPTDKYFWDNRKTYVWYAGDWSHDADGGPLLRPIEFGVAGLQDFADPIKGTSHGLVGALVIEPADATWQTDCQILREAAGTAARGDCLNAAATVTTASGDFREFVLVYQNDASLRYRGEPLPNLRNGDDAEDSGQKAFNYRFEPFWARLDANPSADPETMMDYDYTNVLSSQYGVGDPSTPLFTAPAGMQVRIRIVEPGGHPRNGGFTLSGHSWPSYPWESDSEVQTATPSEQNRLGWINGIGPGRHDNVLLELAGGPEQITGDFLYRSPLGFAFGGGQWGIMRVYPPELCSAGMGGPRTLADPNTGLRQVCR